MAEDFVNDMMDALDLAEALHDEAQDAAATWVVQRLTWTGLGDLFTLTVHGVEHYVTGAELAYVIDGAAERLRGGRHG